jgi:hypothetical protein
LVGATDVRLTAGLLMLEAAVFVCSAMAAECTKVARDRVVT